MPVPARWADWLPPYAKPVSLVPLYPVAVFGPQSTCPHRGPIRDGSDFVCEVCAAVSRANQHLIDKRGKDLPPPEDPERKIARWQREYAQGLMTAQEKLAYQELADELLAIVDPLPRRHVPAHYDRRTKDGRKLKGGLGK